MFGVLVYGVYNNEDNYNFFKIFKTLDEARSFAFEAVHGMGLHATVYDYDKELDEYLEFYSL
jgi:hypothetical protein